MKRLIVAVCVLALISMPLSALVVPSAPQEAEETAIVSSGADEAYSAQMRTVLWSIVIAAILIWQYNTIMEMD